MNPGAVVYSRARLADAGEILTVQRAAFAQEAVLYHEPDIPPLTESLEDIREAIASCIVTVGRLDQRLVAAGRVTISDRIGRIGRLAVAPDLQGRGLGRALLAAVEASCAGAVDAWELFTGSQTAANLHLYHSSGYRDTHVQHIRGELSLVHMRKLVGDPSSVEETMDART
jgi:GNAT superfamily N-acetyltransferase